MTLWETETMEESARNYQWEEINTADIDPQTLVDASAELNFARELINEATDHLIEAVSIVAGTVEEDRITSLYDDLLSLLGEIINKANKYAEGER